MESAWTMLSREPKEPEGVLTDRFVLKFSKYLDWTLLSAHYSFSLDMLRSYQHRVNWSILLTKYKFPEHFLREMASYYFKDCWHIIPRHQTLSESFIHDYADKLDWEDVLLYQTHVSSKFLHDHSSFVGSTVIDRYESRRDLSD